ncbi:MAG: hypothetical protein PCALPYG88_5930 [uncultured Paraburkholderia sp.]|nr:MAG: hypothetical protein PCALPYG08_6132 [uncultured Paraburkholderia sp.]CAH2937342.1 MAG: hypothetical protein PCALPYG88_5930 [uncultured Paraburkholderia sp.]
MRGRCAWYGVKLRPASRRLLPVERSRMIRIPISGHAAAVLLNLSAQLPATSFGLAIIGELCQFLEFGRIVMALSPKPVILAVPIQAWQAARTW